MSKVCVIVMDEPCGSTEAAALTYAYREHAHMAAALAHDSALEVHFSSDDGLWVGGDLPSEARKRLALELANLRQTMRTHLLQPHATAFAGTADDPFASNFFDREPDAWLVSGGGETTLRVESRDAMNAEMERRISKLSKPI